MKKILILIIIAVLNVRSDVPKNHAIKKLEKTDLTIIGITKFNDGLGRIPIGIIDQLHRHIKINLINTTKINIDPEEIPVETLKIISQNNSNLAKVIFVSEIITTIDKVKKLPESSIRILYSMFETTKIPDEWVTLFNKYFDIIVVPDEFLVKVYKDCKVTVPIFVLPIGLYLEDFIRKTKYKKNFPFAFGCLSRFQGRKNQALLIEAFAKEFGDSKDVILKLHGRFLNQDNELKNLISKFNLNNVIITSDTISWEKYVQFMTSLDCYVNISKGEGFSVTPREALASGIPCILTNNTAQKIICHTNFIRSVRSAIKEKADYTDLFSVPIDVGYFSNCNVDDVREALRDVYDNYEKYANKAYQAKNWVINEYSWPSLRKKYLNLVKPKKIILGQNNIITDDYLITNSIKLFNKYRKCEQ